MKRYGLLGRTLKHSFSKTYFTNKFQEEGITDCSYENFELAAIDELPRLLQSVPAVAGLNVTIPYKEDVIPYLTKKNEVVTAISACNCIKIDGTDLVGYNTDVIGFRRTIEPQLKKHHSKALILGTGGASKAVAYVLQQLGIEYLFVSRKMGEGMIGYEDVSENILANHYLIINTTPLGMYPNIDAAPAISYQHLIPQHFLFDLTYNPDKTKFLLEGEKQGAQILNGYEMLIHQAEESWRIWNSNEAW